MFKLLYRKKNYCKPKQNNALSKVKYWKFALTDTGNRKINQKINESRHRYKSTNNMKIYNISSLDTVYTILNNI